MEKNIKFTVLQPTHDLNANQNTSDFSCLALITESIISMSGQDWWQTGKETYL
jgi:hypothetical protein